MMETLQVVEVDQRLTSSFKPDLPLVLPPSLPVTKDFQPFKKRPFSQTPSETDAPSESNDQSYTPIKRSRNDERGASLLSPMLSMSLPPSSSPSPSCTAQPATERPASVAMTPNSSMTGPNQQSLLEITDILILLDTRSKEEHQLLSRILETQTEELRWIRQTMEGQAKTIKEVSRRMELSDARLGDVALSMNLIKDTSLTLNERLTKTETSCAFIVNQVDTIFHDIRRMTPPSPTISHRDREKDSPVMGQQRDMSELLMDLDHDPNAPVEPKIVPVDQGIEWPRELGDGGLGFEEIGMDLPGDDDEGDIGGISSGDDVERNITGLENEVTDGSQSPQKDKRIPTSPLTTIDESSEQSPNGIKPHRSEPDHPKSQTKTLASLSHAIKRPVKTQSQSQSYASRSTTTSQRWKTDSKASRRRRSSSASQTRRSASRTSTLQDARQSQRTTPRPSSCPGLGPVPSSSPSSKNQRSERSGNGEISSRALKSVATFIQLKMSDGKGHPHLWPPRQLNTRRGRMQEIACDSCAGRVHWTCAGFEDTFSMHGEVWNCPECLAGMKRKSVPKERCIRPNCILRLKQKIIERDSDDEQFIPQKIVGHRAIRRLSNGSREFEYLVKWSGWNVNDCTWEKTGNLGKHQDLVEAFRDEATELGIRKKRVALLPETEGIFNEEGDLVTDGWLKRVAALSTASPSVDEDGVGNKVGEGEGDEDEREGDGEEQEEEDEEDESHAEGGSGPGRRDRGADKKDQRRGDDHQDVEDQEDEQESLKSGHMAQNRHPVIEEGDDDKAHQSRIQTRTRTRSSLTHPKRPSANRDGRRVTIKTPENLNHDPHDEEEEEEEEEIEDTESSEEMDDQDDQGADRVEDGTSSKRAQTTRWRRSLPATKSKHVVPPKAVRRRSR